MSIKMKLHHILGGKSKCTATSSIHYDKKMGIFRTFSESTNPPLQATASPVSLSRRQRSNIKKYPVSKMDNNTRKVSAFYCMGK